jgi:hypothetical protein
MIDEIDELEIKQYDYKFGTKSKVFYDTIIVDSGNEEWQIKITNRRNRPICLLHRNKHGRTNKFHIQAYKTLLYHAYDAIYSHKNVLSCIKNKKI